MREVAAPFDSVCHRLRDGEIDREQALTLLGEKLPEWDGSVRRWGGTSLIRPGRTARTTIDLEPGELRPGLRAAGSGREDHGPVRAGPAWRT